MKALAGTGRLIRLALRRDRFTLALWVLILAGLLAMFTTMFVSSFPTHADVVRETRFMAGNAGFRMLSLSSGASIGAYTMSRTYATFAVLAAVMSVLCVVRHTRQNEESGRGELLGAGVVGPAAGLAAGVVVALAANLALAPLLGLAMIAAGQPTAGSLAAGAAIAAVGVAFTGVAAVTAQLSRTARGATGLALAVLAASFLASGLGNVLGDVDASRTVASSNWLGWLSPLGWGYQMRPFGDEQWWLLGLFVAATAALVAVAVLLAARRDLGAGLLPERAGREHASAALAGPFGLAWRLQRPALLGWLVVMLGFGLIFGSVSKDAQTLGDNAQGMYQRLFDTNEMVTAWFTMMVVLAGIGAAIYAVQVLLRMREEEASGRLELILAGAVSRTRCVAGYVVSAVLGATVLLLSFGTAMALTAGAALGDTTGLLRELSTAALAQLPAVLVVATVVVAVMALLPRRATPVSWALLGAAILLSPLFDLKVPQWVRDLSPFGHLHAPAVEVSWLPVAALAGVALAVVAAGLVVFRRRDLAL